MAKHFNCAFGNPFFEGRTSIELQSSGEAKASFARGEQTEAYEGRLAEDTNQKIWEQVEEASLCKMKRIRPGVPGEQIIQFELVEEGETCQGETWSNEQNSNPVLKSLMEALNDMCREISDGKIPQE